MKKNLLLATVCVLSTVSALAQWNSDPAVNAYAWPKSEAYYSNEMGITPDGKTWLAVNFPNYGGVSTAVQLIDTAGNWVFEEPIVLADYDARTWTSCGQILFVDRDGNAIVSVNDFRYGSGLGLENHTVYKISPEGEFLWGEDGITLEGENVYDLVASMSICQLADGSYVFAWQHSHTDNFNMMSIEMQRLSADGEMLWNAEDVRLHDAKVNYMYPYVVDGGSNQVILLYAKGTAQDLYARKLDFDGTPVWSEDTRVYNGGWGSIPIWTLLSVAPSGDGGVLVTWNDDRYFTNIESAYMAYVKPNGELGFNINNGLKLGYSELRAFTVKCIYDKVTDSFIAMWDEASSGQSWNRVVAQRVSKDGELLWSENGLEIKPIEQTNYGYFSVQNSVNDEVAFFYMRNYTNSFGDVEAFVTTVNVNDTTIRRENEFTKGDRISEKSSLKSTPMHDGKYWIVKWEDHGRIEDEIKEDNMMIQRLNVDFTLGNPGDAAVESVKTDNNTFVALASIVENEAMFAVNVPTAMPATLAIYNVNGALVATPFSGVLDGGKQYIEWTANVPAGIYLATLSTSQGVETVKLLVK